MSRKRPTVLILASNPAFAREITAAWPHEPAPRSAAHSNRPEFIVLDQGFSRELEGSHYDLAIADVSFDQKNACGKNSQALRQALCKDRHQALQQSLAAARKPAILVHSDRSLDFYQLHGAVLELRREPGRARNSAPDPGRILRPRSRDGLCCRPSRGHSGTLHGRDAHQRQQRSHQRAWQRRAYAART